MHHQPWPAAGTRVDIALEIHPEEFRTRTAGSLFVWDKRFNPAGFDIGYANSAFPTRVPVGVGHAVGNINIAPVVNGDRARFAELGPLRNEVAFLIENLHAVVAAVRDVKPPFRINFDAMGIVELKRAVAFGLDAAAPGFEEFAVLVEANEAVIATAGAKHVLLIRAALRSTVAICDPNITIFGDHDSGGAVKMRLVGTGDTGDA